MPCVPRKAPCYKRAVEGYRHCYRVQVLGEDPEGLGLCNRPFHSSGRCLPLGQAVYLVVMDKEFYVNIPPYGMDQVIPPLSVAIPVACNSYDSPVVRKPYPC